MNFHSSLLAGGAGFLSLQERQWESKVNLHDQSCSGFIDYFPYCRRFMHQDSPGGGFWRAEGFWLLLTGWTLLGVSDEDRDEEPRLGDGDSCAVPASLSQSRSLGWTPLGRERGVQGRDGHGLKPSFAGQGREGQSCQPVGAAVLLRCGARVCPESSVQLFV